MRFKPHSTKASTFVLFTAKHCGFAPESHEFTNAKNSIQIWANGGYFKAEIEIEGHKDVAAALSELQEVFAVGELLGSGSGATAKWNKETVSGPAGEFTAATCTGSNEFVLLSFVPTEEKLFLTKKDSGSLLSVLGGVPFAALSTLDGEPTSGGASITPLPKIEGDEEIIPPKRKTDGC